MIGRLRKAIINECGLASLIKIHQNSIFQRKKNSSYCPNEKNFLILQLFNIPRVVTCFPQACQLLPTVTAADLGTPFVCAWLSGHCQVTSQCSESCVEALPRELGHWFQTKPFEYSLKLPAIVIARWQGWTSRYSNLDSKTKLLITCYNGYISSRSGFQEFENFEFLLGQRCKTWAKL